MSLNVPMIQESFAAVEPVAGEAMDFFYDTLWSKYPDSKALFEGVDMEKQKHALLHTLAFAVENLENGEALTKALKDLGARHVQYGVSEEHYPWVADAFLTTLRHFFGENWTDELETQWTLVLIFVAETMLAGAAETQAPTQEASSSEPVEGDQLRGQALEAVSDLIADTFKEALTGVRSNEEFREAVRNEVRELIQDVFDEERYKITKKAA